MLLLQCMSLSAVINHVDFTLPQIHIALLCTFIKIMLLILMQVCHSCNLEISKYLVLSRLSSFFSNVISYILKWDYKIQILDFYFWGLLNLYINLRNIGILCNLTINNWKLWLWVSNYIFFKLLCLLNLASTLLIKIVLLL